MLRFAAYTNEKTTFSCFEKVIILDDFWPPNMKPKTLKTWFCELPKYWDFMFFVMRVFKKPSFPLRKTTTFEGSAVCYVFRKFMIFVLFPNEWFLSSLELTFSGFGRFWDHQYRPWPSQTTNFLKEKHGFHKITIFIKKTRF